MKREIVRASVWVVLISFLAIGCISHREPVVVTTPARQVIVTEAPPPPRTEVMGVAPSTAHVWVQGYWVHRDRRWVWVPGHWEARPRVGAMYVAGHWDRTTQGWVWTP